MLFQILKKDMIKRKGINIILFLFIILATVFLASSVNNILVVTNALDYYIDMANVPDVNVLVNTKQDLSKMNDWLEKQKQEGVIEAYDYNQFIALANKSIQIQQGSSLKELDTKGASIYIAKMDVPYNKVFDEQGNTFELNKGEIAVSTSLAESNQLKIGDRIKCKIGEDEREFEIKKLVKDAAFGSEMVGMVRFISSEEDYDILESKSSTIGLYYIDTENTVACNQKLSNEGFSFIINNVTVDTYKMVYSFDMIMAALLILIGICLILIAMLVLRFTLTFTLEEQYQEIGILKAIGFRDFGIKKIYLIKYLAIVAVGALIGLVLSFPVSNFMIASVSKNILMQTGSANYTTNILCALFIVIFVVLFCYFCTRRLNKVSAVTIIRGGETGERFGARRGLSLTKHTHISVANYLGMNSVLTHWKKFTVLLITFSISFILITIPVNTVNTMRSQEMIKKFSINPNNAINVRGIEQEDEEKYSKVSEFKEGMNNLKEKMNEKGYDASVTGSMLYFLSYATPNSKQNQNILTLQLMGDDIHYLEYDHGKEPLLENEVAVSETVMKEHNWVIGDYVTANIEGEEKMLLITGSYSDYMQLGRSARLNPNIQCETLFDYWNIGVNITSSLEGKELANALSKEFPSYEWLTNQEIVDQNVGGIQEILANLILPMTAMLTLIIMLITILMEKLFIAREKGELAMLKSIGFSHKTIRNFHIIRMIWIVICSMALSVPLSLLSNTFMLKPIFAIMGANVSIQVQPLQVYLLYPGILLIGIIIATAYATKGIKKVHIREMNTME